MVFLTGHVRTAVTADMIVSAVTAHMLMCGFHNGAPMLLLLLQADIPTMDDPVAKLVRRDASYVGHGGCGKGSGCVVWTDRGQQESGQRHSLLLVVCRSSIMQVA